MIFRHLRNVQGFFSDYYLGTVFGRGAGRGRRRQLADRETDRAFERLRRIWERAEGRCATAAEVRERLARPLLRDILGYHLGAGQDGIHGLYPSAEVEAGGSRPIVLAHIGGWDDDPDVAPGRGRRTAADLLADALAHTPKPLVDDLVRHALGPLVEGRTSGDIESLRVLDPATGSAHFLVGAMRFLGKALHAVYCREHGAQGPPHFRGRWDSDHEATDEAARAANSEARAWCKRRVAERCLFGVDLNPTAVNLARVSLWIESLAGDRPLTYFEHHIRCGNSLLGTWLDRLGVPPLPGMGDPVNPHALGLLFAYQVKEAIRAAAARRVLIDQAAAEGAVVPESIEELRYKEDRRREAGDTLAAARLLFDLRSASAFDLAEVWSEFPNLLCLAGDRAKLETHCRSRSWWSRFEAVCDRERFFHWELEYPEVFFDGSPGFDAVLGNPPWDKVLPTKHDFYARYDPLIRAYKGNDLDRRIHDLEAAVPASAADFAAYQNRTTTAARLLRHGGDFPLSRAHSQHAHEDVSKYFVDRCARLARAGGAVGLVVPSVVYNGDGCVGIRDFLLKECTVHRFNPGRAGPSPAPRGLSA